MSKSLNKTQEINEAIWYFIEQGFIDELTTDKKHYLGLLITECQSLLDERDTLAYENKAMAKTLEKLGYDIDSLIFKYKEN